MTAQAGVILYVAPTLLGVFWTFLGSLTLYVAVLYVFAPFVLLAAALLPGSSEDEWGSMWPLVGYDNAIDALYVRGPWWERFAEQDEIEAEGRLKTAMREWFQP